MTRKNKVVKVEVRMTEDLKAEVKKRAKKKGLTASEWVRKLIEQDLK